ncbi:MAG: hypothetical protein AAGJ82_08170 [Bacteroidota bacterium]
MNVILKLAQVIGMGLAVFIGAGYVATTNFDSAPDTPITEQVAMASVAEQSTLTAPAADERMVRVRPAAPATGQRTVAADRRPAPADRASRPARTAPRHQRAISGRAIEDWIQVNAASTYLEAEQETISPGVILATGVYFLQEGQGDASMTATDVSAYLAAVRQAASAEAKAHMKYIANSEEWFEGLQLAGFDGAQLRRIFRSHQLAAYDQQMYSRHVSRKVERGTEYTVANHALAAEATVRDRELAGAYNDYADRTEVRQKFDLPTLTAPAPMDKREVSSGRQEAESFEPGESRTYQSPREFWAVLQEMIALENDYSSWEAYRASNRTRADKAFQMRSDIMAKGGIMKVTRRKGA